MAIRLSREGGEMDRLARLKTARREGIAIGEKRGRAEGSHAKAVEMARSMIENNFPDSISLNIQGCHSLRSRT